MNALIEQLNRWGEPLLQFAWPMLWQSSLLTIVLFALDFALRKKVRASVRYALWLVVIIKLLVPPTLAAPTSIAWWLRPSPTPNPPAKRFVVTYPVAGRPQSVPDVYESFARQEIEPPVVTLSLPGWSLVASGLISVGLLTWMMRRWWQVARMVRGALPATDSLLDLIGDARRKLGLRRTVRLRLTREPMSPAVCGLFRPVVLLPRPLAEQLTPTQLRAVLLHELVHLKRGDVWVNCAQALLQIAYWWHPLLWFANARIRCVREEAVDDAVMLALREEADSYAPTLLEVAKLAFRRPLATLGLVGIMESRNSLRQRIERLVNFRPPRKSGSKMVSLLLLLGFAALAVPMEKAPPKRIFTADRTDELGATLPQAKIGWRPYFVQHNHLQLDPLEQLAGTNASSTPIGGISTDSSDKSDQPVEFLTRTYKVDPNTFYRAAPKPINPTNSAAAVRAFFAELGIDRNQEPGKLGRSVFFTDGTGLLMVRATPEELDAVERAIQKLNTETTKTNAAPEPGKTDFSRNAEIANLVQHGRLLIELGKLEDAAIELNQALTIDPENKAARFYLGLTKKSQISESPNSSSAFNGGNSTNLYVRTYKLDPNTFYQGLESVGSHSVNGTNTALAMRALLSGLGVDLSPPKSVFWNDRNGLLLVRATKQDLDVIESAIQVLNTTPPQVNIKAKFVEVPAKDAERFLNMVFTNTPAGGTNGFTGILTGPQADKLMAEIKSIKGAELTSAPELTTLSGRQAQIQMVDLKTIVTGLTPVNTNGVTNLLQKSRTPVLSLPFAVLITNSLTHYLPQTTTMPFGSVLDVIPYVSADGYTVQMTLTPTVTEFLGYDDPGSFQPVETPIVAKSAGQVATTTVAADLPSKSQAGQPVAYSTPALPLPKTRVRQISTTANVWDGQTIVLCNFPVKEISTRPDGSKMEKDVTSKFQKQLLVFVTPTIIDQAGNRVHTEAEMPFAREGVPVQKAK